MCIRNPKMCIWNPMGSNAPTDFKTHGRNPSCGTFGFQLLTTWVPHVTQWVPSCLERELSDGMFGDGLWKDSCNVVFRRTRSEEELSNGTFDRPFRTRFGSVAEAPQERHRSTPEAPQERHRSVPGASQERLRNVPGTTQEAPRERNRRAA